MKQPAVFEKGSGLVCKLKKVFYRLKQVPWAGHQKLNNCLISCDFLHSKSDISFFIKIKWSDILQVLVYVDYTIITGNSTSNISSLISQPNATFP